MKGAYVWIDPHQRWPFRTIWPLAPQGTMAALNGELAVASSSDATPAGYVHERRGGDKTHFCVACSFPIAVYGRLQPCLHAFCLSCASDMDGCFL